MSPRDLSLSKYTEGRQHKESVRHEIRLMYISTDMLKMLNQISAFH